MRSESTISLSCQTCALRQELRFVHQHAMQRAMLGNVAPDLALQVVVAFERDAFRAQADARGHHAGAGAVVQARGEDRHAHAALAVVVRRLQQRRGLAGVHRRIIEIELGHARILRCRARGADLPAGFRVRGRCSHLAHVADVDRTCADALHQRAQVQVLLSPVGVGARALVGVERRACRFQRAIT